MMKSQAQLRKNKESQNNDLNQTGIIKNYSGSKLGKELQEAL